MTAVPQRKRALYVALRDEKYPRNARVRAFLSDDLDMDIDIVHLTRSGGYVRHCAELLAGGLSWRRKYDLVVNAEFSLTFAWVAWVIAKRNRAVFVVDFFVGLVETLVVDRAIVQKSSMRGRILAACDSFAARSADVLVTDTRVRAERLSARPKIVHPALSLPVGAPEWARPRPKPRGDEVRENTKLLYYGNYVPLHGVPTLLEGIAAISPTVHWTLTMVGRGQDLGLALEACDRLGISDRTTFVDSVPEAALADLIHEHDVVLGIFGQSDKAATVIANKVWQGLACGKVVVTRRSPALAEIEDIVGSLLEQVDSADAPAITAALTAIAKRAATPDAQSYSGADVADALETYVAEKYAAFGDRLRELAAQR